MLTAPRLLTTVELLRSSVSGKIFYTSRAMMSGEPPGAEPTTNSTVLLSFHSCAAAAVAKRPIATAATSPNPRSPKLLQFQ